MHGCDSEMVGGWFTRLRDFLTSIKRKCWYNSNCARLSVYMQGEY